MPLRLRDFLKTQHQYPFFNALISGIEDRSRPWLCILRTPHRRKGQEMYFDQVEFGKRIRKLRKAQGKKQDEMAEEFYISVEHLSRLENGKVGISIDLLLEMSDGFAVSTDYLLTGKDRNQYVDVDRLKLIVNELNTLLSEA